MADLAGKMKVLIRGREDGKTILDRLLPDKSKDQRLEIYNPLNMELGQFVVLDYVDGEGVWAPYDLDMEHFRRDTWELVEVLAYTRETGGARFPYTIYTLHDGEDTAYIWAEKEDGALKLRLLAQRDAFGWDEKPDLINLLEEGGPLFDEELEVDAEKEAHWTAQLVILTQDEKREAAISETTSEVHSFLHQREDTTAESMVLFEIQEGWVYVLQSAPLLRSEISIV
ncbi:MAG: hypothetical protein V1800_03480 [Candidatus Latescibacterota bacterium]